ncbi:hypothetical protein ACSMXN_22005 [Jatrophihabitans sp. DSM 45814]
MAEEHSYDAPAIGRFYDPFLRAAREVSQAMPITAPAEACLHIANTLGERVSIFVGQAIQVAEVRASMRVAAKSGTAGAFGARHEEHLDGSGGVRSISR